MEKEYLYKSHCFKCKSDNFVTFGVGTPLKKNYHHNCSDCDSDLEINELTELNIVGKDVISKPLNIGVLNG